MKKRLCLLILALCALPLCAEIKMPAIFSDNMVLQQGSEVKIWGKAQPGARVEGVRYLWKSWAQPDVCIYNEDGLPAMQFIYKK